MEITAQLEVELELPVEFHPMLPMDQLDSAEAVVVKLLQVEFTDQLVLPHQLQELHMDKPEAQLELVADMDKLDKQHQQLELLTGNPDKHQLELLTVQLEQQLYQEAELHMDKLVLHKEALVLMDKELQAFQVQPEQLVLLELQVLLEVESITDKQEQANFQEVVPHMDKLALLEEHHITPQDTQETMELLEHLELLEHQD